MNRERVDRTVHTPRSRFQGLHLMLLLITCLLASQVLTAHEGAL